MEGTKARHWRVVRLRSIQLTTGKRAERTKRDFRYVLSLLKPVVWFAPAVVNWRSRSVAKSAYSFLVEAGWHTCRTCVITTCGILKSLSKNMLVTMVVIPFCVYFIYLFINWSWLNSLYILTYIPLDTKQQRTTSEALGNGKRFMLLRTKVRQWLLKFTFAMVCNSEDKFS